LELRFQLEWTVLENSVEAELQTQRAAVEREVQRASEAITYDRHCEPRKLEIEHPQKELPSIQEDLENQMVEINMMNSLSTMHMSTNDEPEEANDKLKEAKKAAVVVSN
jgi:hypothetical protein